jgi:ABC-type nitrate/sulfonate/bicarbonate transport system ATPase subunit
MDEPFSGLDLLMLEKTCELICKVADMDDLNTIIVVTHDVTAACSVADHLWLMGHDRDTTGTLLPGSRMVKEYNLIEQDLCWHPSIITTPKFTDFVREIKGEFRRL